MATFSNIEYADIIIICGKTDENARRLYLNIFQKDGFLMSKYTSTLTTVMISVRRAKLN